MKTTIMMLLALALEISSYAVYRAWLVTGKVFYMGIGRAMMTVVFVIIIYTVLSIRGKRKARE